MHDEDMRKMARSSDIVVRQGQRRPWEDISNPANRAAAPRRAAAIQAARQPAMHHAEGAHLDDGSAEVRHLVRQVVTETKHAVIDEVAQVIGAVLRAGVPQEATAPAAPKQERRQRSEKKISA